MVNVWVNDDGLATKYRGPSKTKAGEHRGDDAGEHVLELVLDWEDMPAYDAAASAIEDGYATGGKILNPGIRFPGGGDIHIVAVEIETLEAWDSAGDNLTMDIGLIDTDRSTEWDFNGIVEAATQGELNACVQADPSASINVSGWVGDLVGTTISNSVPGLLTVDIGSATATAGTSIVRIRYRSVPKTTDTLGTTLS